MSSARLTTHPMIEPIDFALTPDRAKSSLSEPELAVYTLVYDAALATAAEGPAIHRQKILFKIDGAGLSPILQLQVRLIENPGWYAALPHEEPPLGASETHQLPISFQSALDAIQTRLEPDGSRVRDVQACKPLVASLASPVRWICKLANLTPEPLKLDQLIEQMAENGVGRPSTYASTIDKALKHDLVQQKSGHLFVGRYGDRVLKKIAALPEESRVNAQYSRDLEEELTRIETDPSGAGEVLRKFSQQATGNASGMVAWLQNLDIEGESLAQTVDRLDQRLPVARSWEGADLPSGLDPLRMIRAPDRAAHIRSDVDRILAEPNIKVWNSLAPRMRATQRLAAFAIVHCNFLIPSWATHGSRDLALRWWIDLGPDEPPIHEEELWSATAAVSEVYKRNPDALQVALDALPAVFS